MCLTQTHLNLFYFSPIIRKSISIELKGNENIEDLYKNISSKESIPENEFKLYSNGKSLNSTKQLTNDSVICLHFGLNGGKGGFGSMLRAIGAQIEKTTNREACRDLTGRRLRDINEEKRIKEWIKKEKLRKEEMEEKRKQKLQKLSQKPKTEFNDLEFERNRNEIPDIVDEALQYGLQLQQSAGPSKRKSEETTATKSIKKKKVDLWIGEDIDIEDDSDDNESQTNDKTEDQSTKDSIVSNDDTNDSEVTNDSNIIVNQSLPQKPDESNEEIVPQIITNTEEESTSSSVSGKVNESMESICINVKPTQTENKESSDSCGGKPKEQVFEALNLMQFQNIQQLESLGLDRLKQALIAIGLKCGGTLNERANRLWSIRGKDIKEIPKKLFAKKK